MKFEMTAANQPEPATTSLSHPGRRLLVAEIFTVTTLAVGISAMRSVLSFTAALSSPAPITAQRTTLNASRTPEQPWIDLGYQLVFVLSLLLPVVLVVVMVRVRGESLQKIGLSTQCMGRRIGIGLAAAAGTGGLGLIIYLTAYSWGLSRAIIPTSLPDVWWRIPILILSAGANAVLEEVVLAGYLIHRLSQLKAHPVTAIGVSAGIRGLYHLYQGLGGLIGNAIMGAAFAGYFLRRRTVIPQIVAHAAIDVVAFLGYLLLADRVSWLPG
ncbi:MAG: CPBP family intramembrane glutamic endopeptidase [Actinomycetota bacterium]